MQPARLASLTYELAATAVDDGALARELGVARETVEALSQGRDRRHAADGIGPADLAAGAAAAAIAGAGLDAGAVDFIVFSTNTPDYTFPGSACLLQASLGCGPVGCLDVRAACSGFVVALDLARRYVGSGTYARVLVACAEVPSHQNRFDGIAPEITCLTGDAAAAALVVGGDGPASVLAACARMDGSAHRLLWCEFPASRHMSSTKVERGERLTRAAIEEGKIFPIADFERLREAALTGVPRVLEEALVQARIDRVDIAVVAHLDARTEKDLAGALATRAGRVLRSDVLYSYSASLPVALARAVERGDIVSGETVALVTAGAGASWAAAVLRM